MDAETRAATHSQNRHKGSPPAVEAEMKQSILSPNFRSAAAMAGWDEEALLLATLIVEDTPIRNSQHKKRSLSGQNLNSSPAVGSTSTRRKQRGRKRKPLDPLSAVTLCLDDTDEGSFHQEAVTMEKELGSSKPNGEKEGDSGIEGLSGDKHSGKELPCMDRLRDELSCAICLEICYEPSTTSCGHSFCITCLKCAANKCGNRCPKCRQMISNGRSCTVNTVLWNTIQLLFPAAVKARKEAALDASSGKAASKFGLKLENNLKNRRNFLRSSSSTSSSFRSAFDVLESGTGEMKSGRRLNSSRFDDASLAIRLQREEFLLAFMNSRGRNREQP